MYIHMLILGLKLLIIAFSGLRQQSYQIPLSFFRDELINNKKIVFTGKILCIVYNDW